MSGGIIALYCNDDFTKLASLAIKKAFDYAGASLSNGFLSGDTEVDGDIALQTIIDNNYKYRMKRKGE